MIYLFIGARFIQCVFLDGEYEFTSSLKNDYLLIVLLQFLMLNGCLKCQVKFNILLSNDCCHASILNKIDQKKDKFQKERDLLPLNHDSNPN